MAAHLTRDGGGPPPPTRNEVLLREAIDRLRLQLDTAREVVEATREAGHGPTALHWNPQCVQCQAIATYDKAMGGQ